MEVSLGSVGLVLANQRRAVRLSDQWEARNWLISVGPFMTWSEVNKVGDRGGVRIIMQLSHFLLIISQGYPANNIINMIIIGSC